MAAAAVPTFSVIVATHNRSNVLAYAIRSVLAQTRADFELLVIGDGCTDDTAAVVAGFGDPRLRYENLDPRVGDQSGPTNRGFALARGRYLALLNHDDLWFPDHLARAGAALERGDADLVFPLQLELDPDGRWRMNSVFPHGFDPLLHPNASAWVLRRELAGRTGSLVHRDETYSYPTRHWLIRAWRAGARLAAVPAATVVVISATTRRNTYRDRPEREHAAVWAAMTGDPGFREACLVDAWMHPRQTHLRALAPRVLLRALAMRAGGRLAQWCGVDPEALYCYAKFPRRYGILPVRGSVIAELYRRRGLSGNESAPAAVGTDSNAPPPNAPAAPPQGDAVAVAAAANAVVAGAATLVPAHPPPSTTGPRP